MEAKLYIHNECLLNSFEWIIQITCRQNQQNKDTDIKGRNEMQLSPDIPILTPLKGIRM